MFSDIYGHLHDTSSSFRYFSLLNTFVFYSKPLCEKKQKDGVQTIKLQTWRSVVVMDSLHNSNRYCTRWIKISNIYLCSNNPQKMSFILYSMQREIELSKISEARCLKKLGLIRKQSFLYYSFTHILQIWLSCLELLKWNKSSKEIISPILAQIQYQIKISTQNRYHCSPNLDS